MKYVGEAVKELEDDKLVLLGIANWTTVINKELLIHDSMVRRAYR